MHDEMIEDIIMWNQPGGECDVLNYFALPALKEVLSTFTEKL